MIRKLTVNYAGTREAIGRTGYQILCMFADNDFDDIFAHLSNYAETLDNPELWDDVDNAKKLKKHISYWEEDELFYLAMEMCEVRDIYDDPDSSEPDKEGTGK